MTNTRRLILGIMALLAVLGMHPERVMAQEENFFVGQVIDVIEQVGKKTNDGAPLQRIMVEFTEGRETKRVEAEYGKVYNAQPLVIGDRVVIVQANILGEITYHVSDIYRLPSLGLILLIFFATVLIMTRLKGLGSLLGLILSIIVLGGFIVPRILAGNDPFIISLIGATAIALVSIYPAHGVSRRTTVAVLATIITLGIAAILSSLFVALARLTGGAGEDAFYLQLTAENSLNLHGLFLGAIIIGTLGVLDDITTAQAAAVDELHKANPTLSRRELFRRGLSIGKEHITSLVNTLVLAYAGASLPLFLLFSIKRTEPLWFLLNNEFIAEELIRTLVGSTTLVLAVPIATLLAARMLTPPSPTATPSCQSQPQTSKVPQKNGGCAYVYAAPE